MKKYLPLILLGLGILIVLIVVVFVVKNKNKKLETEPEEETFIELSIDKRPVVSLTPTEDGHYLKLEITKINIQNASTMDFMFNYDVPGGVPQGSSGDNIDITNIDKYETDLLLGSESSGKFRYDEGVETGIITLWFRGENGKLLTKMSSDFRMLKGVEEITSIDDQFKYKFKSKTTKGYYLVINTMGIPDGFEFESSLIKSGPYGLFSSESKVLGDVDNNSLKVYKYSSGKWEENSSGLGIFVMI